MPKASTFLVFLTSLFFSMTTWAQVQCADVFARDVEAELVMILGYGPQPEFVEAKMNLSQSRGLEQTNDNLYNLVVKGNEVLDHVVDVIMQLNFMEMPKEVKDLKSMEAEILVEDLQRSFGINDNAMQAAVHNRIGAEIAQIEARSEAAEIRRAIGFGRDQSAEEFHANPPPPQPIGFRPAKAEKENSVETEVEKVAIGFVTKEGKEKLEDSIEDIVESDQMPMGFVPVKMPESQGPVKAEPIGFVHPKKVSDEITNEKLHKIGFDIELGEFVFVKGEQ